jgi:hypothetical protein
MQFRQLRTLATAAVILGLSVVAAHADAIDGDWCQADGRHMTIRGPDIVTPGGTKMRGDYSRHSFSYVVPAGEPGAGETVSIVLLNELLAHGRQGGPNAPVQEWRRCAARVS